MAQIVTITNPLTGQPAQVDPLDHTAQEIDDAIARALPGGEIDMTWANKLGGIESTDYPGCYYRLVNGVVEWFNPPMEIGGVEYRTTERYNGYPVYKRAVNIGDITGDGKSTFANNGAGTILSCEILYSGYLPFTYIHNSDLSNSWTRYASVSIVSSKIEISYFIGSSWGTSKNTVVILRYLKG